MVDDSYGSATDFDTMLNFLHEKFFPRCAFGPMYLKPSKSFFFFPSLEFLGLEGNLTGLRPSLKKRDQILGWPTLQCQEEVEAFLYLTPFLRRFIPGRAEHHRILSGTKDKSAPFEWTAEKEASFLAIKNVISENAMAAVDPTLQYHLAVDASKRATGGVLFQLHDVPSGTQAGPEHRHLERIIMFISFKLSDAEPRYTNSECEALAVIRNLAEVRWLITASPHSTMVYTDHEALKTLLVGVDNDAYGRIANWQDRLGKYNVQLFHRCSKIHFMGIADGLSQLPTRLLSQHVMEDSHRPAPVLSVASATIVAAPYTDESATRCRDEPLQGKFDGVWKVRNSTTPGQDEDPMTGLVTDWWELPPSGKENEGYEVGRQRESSMASGGAEWYEEGGRRHNKGGKNHGGSGVSGGGGVEGYGKGGYDQNKHRYGKNHGESGFSGDGGVEWHEEGGSQSNKHNCGKKHGGPGVMVAEGGSGEVGGRVLKADGE
jgi:hypothetical protein